MIVGLCWTLGLLAALYGVDRLLVGPDRVPGWQPVERLDALAIDVQRVAVPAYLPEEVAWPPVAIQARSEPSPGWWIGLGLRANGLRGDACAPPEAAGHDGMHRACDPPAAPPGPVPSRQASGARGLSPHAGGGEIAIWIGSGALPPPPALGDVAACLAPSPRAGCPDGWRALSTVVPGRGVVHVLSRLAPAVSKRLVDRLGKLHGAP